MRIVSVFAFILVSISLLSESYHYVGAIGLDSASHGLLYGGRVVRRYEDMYKVLQKRRISDSQQEQQPTRLSAKTRVSVNKSPPAQDVKIGTPQQQPAQDQSPDQTLPPNQTQTPNQSPPSPPPKPKVNKIKPTVDDTTDNTPPPNSPKQQTQQGPADSSDLGKGGGQSDRTSTPTVATGSFSPVAVAGLASVGGVFVLVGGLFAFSQRRKNKEITKSIVSSSSKAWEQQQQNPAYEIMEETKPIGTYLVVATYTPTLSDELEIQIGDKVTILKEYDDGWVLGVNETRDGIKEGVFPRHCVDMDNTSDKFDKAKAAKRSSSMGVYAAGGYTEVDLN